MNTNEFINNLILSGDILARTLSMVKEKIKIGFQTKQIDQLINNFIIENNAKPAFIGYNKYKHASCISVNNILVHGLPGKYITKNGDIVSIDIGVDYKGAITDGAITLSVGRVPNLLKDAIANTQLALKKGIEKCRVGNKINDISIAIEYIARDNGLGVIKELSGHGTGSKLHLPPSILNYYSKNNNQKIEEGMVLAIEPMFSLSLDGKIDPSITVGSDKWSIMLKSNNIGIHFEHTVLITNNSPLILTKIIDNILPLW